MTAMPDVHHRSVAATHSVQLYNKSKMNVAKHSGYTYIIWHALYECSLKVIGFKL